jgi:hypothetical protein
MSKLTIIGDSYTEPPKDHNPRVWYQQVADQLGLELVNLSMPGVSQDWCWLQLQHLFHNKMITAGDQLIVVLTHPSRFWYLERLPDLSNSWITDLDKWCSSEEARAIELFIKHIQRPSLDILQVINRLGWLAYQSQKLGIRPLIIKAFNQEVAAAADYPELSWARGSLMTDVQYWELHDPHSEKLSDYFYGMDCRYNHLCLTNHDLLAAGITEFFKQGSTVDLTEGFCRGLLADNGLYDDEFCQRELYWDRVVENRKFRAEKKWTKPWAMRQKLHNAGSA